MMQQQNSPYNIPVRSVRYRVCYSEEAYNRGKGMLISFDYAIKFLLKNKENFGVIENFISSLFQTVGKPKIKILRISDPENQKSDPNSKTTIPDLLVEDETGKKYIIEIERGKFANAAYKALFNVSHAITHGFIGRGNEKFYNIHKVIHISILYENDGKVDNYVYHERFSSGGEPNTKGKLIIEKIRDGKRYNTLDDFPEFFFIFPNKFPEAFKNKFDEWMHLLHTGEIRKEALEAFGDFKDVEQRLNYLNFTDEEKLAFDKFQVDCADERSKREESKDEGREEGRKEGRKEGSEKEKIAIAKNLFKMGLSKEDIAKAISLSPEELSKLMSKVKSS